MEVRLKPIRKWSVFGNDKEDEVFHNGKCSLKCLEPNTLNINPVRFYRLPPSVAYNILEVLLTMAFHNEKVMWGEMITKTLESNNLGKLVEMLRAVLYAISPFATVEGLVDPSKKELKEEITRVSDINSNGGFDLLWYYLRYLANTNEDIVKRVERVEDILLLWNNLNNKERNRVERISKCLGYTVMDGLFAIVQAYSESNNFIENISEIVDKAIERLCKPKMNNVGEVLAYFNSKIRLLSLFPMRSLLGVNGIVKIENIPLRYDSYVKLVRRIAEIVDVNLPKEGPDLARAMYLVVYLYPGEINYRLIPKDVIQVFYL